MKSKFLKERLVSKLQNEIEINLDRYRSDKFEFLDDDPAAYFEGDVEIDINKLSDLRLPSDQSNFDVINSKLMFEAFPNLTPYEAADERLWVMLSHTLLLAYSRERWPIPADDKEAIKHIQLHYFARTQRQVERDNVGSRLWWMGHLCSRTTLPIDRALEVLLHRSDVRANVIERPTTAQSIPVFSAIVKKLSESFDGNQDLFERSKFRKLMAHLNRVGGYHLLDAMSENWVEQRIDEHTE